MRTIVSHAAAVLFGALSVWLTLDPGPFGPEHGLGSTEAEPGTVPADARVPGHHIGIDPPASPPECGKACDIRVAKVESWCTAQVWAAGGAMPVEWPDEVQAEWSREGAEAAIEEALDECFGDVSWTYIDCDEFPCALFFEGENAPSLDCDALPRWPNSQSIWGESGKMQAKFYYPVDARDGDLERFTRRESTRIKEAFSRMVADREGAVDRATGVP